MTHATVLQVARPVACKRGSLWALWTTAAGLSRWWWPEHFHTTYQIDARPGGSYRFTTVDVPPVGVLDLSGIFEDVDEPSGISYTWSWGDDAPHVSYVHVSFEPNGKGTIIRLNHRGLKDAADCDNHMQGWNDCLDRLAHLDSEPT